MFEFIGKMLLVDDRIFTINFNIKNNKSDNVRRLALVKSSNGDRIDIGCLQISEGFFYLNGLTYSRIHEEHYLIIAKCDYDFLEMWNSISLMANDAGEGIKEIDLDKIDKDILMNILNEKFTCTHSKNNRITGKVFLFKDYIEFASNLNDNEFWKIDTGYSKPELILCEPKATSGDA